MERFLNKLDELTADLALTRKETYIFIDSNIDLLNLQSMVSSNYLNLIFNHGFLQSISKATRIQNFSKSLIDHILTNSNSDPICTGTLISDISDPFLHLSAYKTKTKICNTTNPS